jgi:hypothetical protein
MAWSDAARAAAAEARRRKKKPVVTGTIKFHDNDGGGPYTMVNQANRKDLLNRIAQAKGHLKGTLPYGKKGVDKYGNKWTQGSLITTPQQAKLNLNKARKLLYGQAAGKFLKQAAKMAKKR